MKLDEIIQGIVIWDNWANSYREFVPQFIEEAKIKEKWEDWDKKLFFEFFEKSNNQCVSSLQQGYYTNTEKEKIKNNWSELAPLLKKIAIQQDQMDLATYNQIKKWINNHTSQNRKAATNRLIASLQPNLLCTIVNERALSNLIKKINQKDTNTKIKNSSNWFENSNVILSYFKDKIPHENVFEIMTYPWQTYELLNQKDQPINTSNEMSEINEMDSLKELLQYKKQIILQGPPGTGKTRLAKEIAEKITANNSLIDIYDILKNFKKDEKILSSNGKTSYLIKEVKSDRIVLTGDNRKVDDTIVFEKLIDCLNNREKYPLGTGLNSQYNAVADYVEKLNEDSQQVSNNFSDIPEMDQNFVKLIQFHPSYTYEDFVRGIVAKPNPDGKGIIYEAENKTLGLFAKIALENYIDSKKNEDVLSYEKWVYSIFEKFVEHIKLKINTDNISLTEKVNIVSVDEDAFRYKGKKGWTKLGNRMLFEDIIKSIIDKNTTRQQLKNNSNLSGLAQWHASYYIRVVDLFNNFINESKLEYIATKETKIEEKNYVLIIDEINRANLSSVLGELIYALEYRGEAVESMYAVEDDNNNKLTLPPNLYIIGTMNTADRSVGHIDYAIRRRFAFVDVLPQDLSDDNAIIFDRKLFLAVKELFTTDDYKTHSAYLSKEFEPKDVALGHSYFIDKSTEGGSVEIRLEYEIKPILFEYVKDGVLIGHDIKTKIEDLKASI